MKLKACLLAVMSLCLLTPAFAPDAGAEAGKVYLIPIKGTIGPGIAKRMVSRIKQAEKENADVILLELDTFGGLLASGVQMRDALLKTDIPTISFVNMHAISAGALIALATDKIYMAPGSTFGAATPQKLTLRGIKPVGEKMLSYFRSEMKSTADAKGHPGLLAEAMVDKDVVVKGVVEKGKLLTLSTVEAVKLKLAEAAASSKKEVLELANLAGHIIVSPPEGWGASGLLDLIKRWQLWIVVGIVLVIVEIFTAGFFALWFAIGAFAAALASWLGMGGIWQIFILAAVSAALLVASRTIFQKFLYKDKEVKSNVDALVGRDALVIEGIPDDLTTGRVKVGGENWSAVIEEKSPVAENERVKVVAVKGNKLVVKKIKAEEV